MKGKAAANRKEQPVICEGEQVRVTTDEEQKVLHGYKAVQI